MTAPPTSLRRERVAAALLSLLQTRPLAPAPGLRNHPLQIPSDLQRLRLRCHRSPRLAARLDPGLSPHLKVPSLRYRRSRSGPLTVASQPPNSRSFPPAHLPLEVSWTHSVGRISRPPAAPSRHPQVERVGTTFGRVQESQCNRRRKPGQPLVHDHAGCYDRRDLRPPVLSHRT